MNIKQFKVTEAFGESSVTLEVDMDKLTVETATAINAFWSGADERLQEENGDLVRAVIRYFGLHAIRAMLSHDGAAFSHIRTCGAVWTKELHEEEGWGGPDDTLFGHCGIRIIAADVMVPSFESLELEAL